MRFPSRGARPQPPPCCSPGTPSLPPASPLPAPSLPLPAPSPPLAAHLLQCMNTGRDSTLQWLCRLSGSVQQRRTGGSVGEGAAEEVGPASISWSEGGGGKVGAASISV